MNLPIRAILRAFTETFAILLALFITAAMVAYACWPRPPIVGPEPPPESAPAPAALALDNSMLVEEGMTTEALEFPLWPPRAHGIEPRPIR